MLYHECPGYGCECHGPRSVDPKPDSGISRGRCSLRWSRDEVARHFYCVILLRSVQARFLSIVAEANCDLGLGELTFLQLSTTYAPVVAGRSVGYVSPENPRHAGPECLRPI